MPRRPAIVTQAEIGRMIRAAHAAGLRVVRIVWRADVVVVETDAASAPTAPVSADDLDRELAEYEARNGTR